MNINDAIKSSKGLVTDKLEQGSSKKSAKAEVAAAQTEGASGENVTLSPMAAQMKSLEAKVAAANVFDSSKVDSIKSAIASGQFKVNSEKVADGLMQTVKDLIKR